MSNKKLVNYGIHTEESDIRIHVCVKARAVYVFPREAALAAVNQHACTDQAGHKQVFTNDVMTATGYAIPVEEIEPIYEIPIPRGWLSDDYRDANAHIVIHKQMDTSAKGRLAEKLVRWMWARNYLSMIAPISIQQERQLGKQIKGIDLSVVMPTVQVKCDFDGGSKKHGGTGNLFIQLSECNPNKRV